MWGACEMGMEAALGHSATQIKQQQTCFPTPSRSEDEEAGEGCTPLPQDTDRTTST